MSLDILTFVSSSRNTIQDEFFPKEYDKLRKDKKKKKRVTSKLELNNEIRINRR